MMYEVEYSKRAVEQLKKLDKASQKIIISWITKNLVNCENPRVKGKALVGNHKGEWRYRIGDYRLICDIRDSELLILALAVGHRKDI